MFSKRMTITSTWNGTSGCPFSNGFPISIFMRRVWYKLVEISWIHHFYYRSFKPATIGLRFMGTIILTNIHHIPYCMTNPRLMNPHLTSMGSTNCMSGLEIAASLGTNPIHETGVDWCHWFWVENRNIMKYKLFWVDIHDTSRYIYIFNNRLGELISLTGGWLNLFGPMSSLNA